MPKVSRKVYDPRSRKPEQRRFEWVELNDGAVCIWAMMVAETLTLVGNSLRPPEWPGSPVDETAAILWQIMLTCHDDEPPHGKRIFEDHMAPDVGALTHHEFRNIMSAIGRLNSTGDDNLEGLKAFFPPEGDEPRPS